ncbi:small subunit of acetolactate synthase-domain-containing protein [Dunaliella salina]|uniref:Small subunit of acetolactate synthase-domain-containing protein n=1 Tax=Dunaliella salina TaxID=3046 RepID=A0ABQ7G473_DUNSA|nr:small subunit of acetolactate synthase-domain-containing protein [Dunaliella salina]|eukprot:KAF5829413.1 small subunit of acetolactate synthase-domain-containing protein [Dunaliella salina]
MLFQRINNRAAGQAAAARAQQSTLLPAFPAPLLASQPQPALVNEGVGSRRQRREVKARVAAENDAAQEGESYDVYVNQPKPLNEGEEKRIISVFVADESGMINRVAGVFARRSANIESLAVGLTVDKALFTIVVTGNPVTVVNLVKQLQKLVKVRYVEDITESSRIEREMMIMKLRAPPGPDRTEVLQLAQIFRARVVDVSDRSLTLVVSGDPGKCMAMQKVMGKFGIIEIARTGRICLKRGEQLLEPGAGFNSPPRPLATMSIDDLGNPSPNDTLVIPHTAEAQDNDVYVVDDAETSGVWEVSNILESTYQGSNQHKDFEAHTLNIEVLDVPGVLNQVTSVFARRGYNVQSLAVGSSEREGRSRICMMVPGTQPDVDKLVRQLYKLVFVESVKDLTPEPYVSQELVLCKVKCSVAQRGELRDLAAIFRCNILDVSRSTMTFEVLGKEEKMKALSDLLEPYGILEIARTGRVAVSRESQVDSKYLERMQRHRVL